MHLTLALLAAAQASPETTRVIIERTWLDQVATIGQSLVSLLVLIMLVMATFTLLALRRALDELTRLVRSTSSDITGAVHDARVMVEELRGLSGRVRGTADLVRGGMRRAKRVVDFVRDSGEGDDGADNPAAPDRPDRRERRRDDGGESRFEEQSMAETNRDERLVRKRRRRRRGGERPRSSDGGGSAAAEPGDSPE